MGQILQIRILTIEFQRPVRSTVAILANERIHFGLLTKSFYAGCDDKEFTTISHCHACAIDCLVRHPGRSELVRLHHGNDLLYRLIQCGDILETASLSSHEVSFEIISDIHAGMDQLVLLITPHDHLEVNIGQPPQKSLLRPIEAGSQRGDQIAKIVLDAINSSSNVGGANSLLSAETDEVVLVVIGKPQDLVRDDVTNVDDQCT